MNEQELAALAQKYPRFFDLSVPGKPCVLVDKSSTCYDAEKQDNLVWVEIQPIPREKNKFYVFGEGGKVIYYGKNGEYPRLRHFIKIWVILEGKGTEKDILLSEGMATPRHLEPPSNYFDRHLFPNHNAAIAEIVGFV